MNGITAIAARIQQIDALLGRGPATAAQPSSSDFASTLQTAMSDSVTGTGTPDATTTSGSSSATGADVVADARRYLGVPYLWGGTDPSKGLDCSGLVQRVYADLGIQLPRVASDQATVGQAVPSLAQAQPGDILAFGSPVHHVGIYVGNGMMIAAPHTGARVCVQPVYETPSAIRRVLSSGGGQSAEFAVAGSGATPYANLFASATARYGLPQGLLAAVAQVESNFDPTAVSGAGAEGLMQLMPATADGLGVNPLDPAQAIDGAARLLATNLQQFQSIPLAVAAYNAGSGAVERYGGIPPYPETQNYVRKVTAAMTAAGGIG